MMQLPLFISGAEIAFIGFILVMVFGADKIPEIARGLGKGMRQVKDATNDIKREITNTTTSVTSEQNIVTKELKDTLEDVKKDIDEISGSVKRTF